MTKEVAAVILVSLLATALAHDETWQPLACWLVILLAPVMSTILLADKTVDTIG